MIRILLTILLLSGCSAFASPTTEGKLDLLVIVGAPGDPRFDAPFHEAATKWMKAAETSHKSALLLEPKKGDTNELEEITEILSRLSATDQELWIVLIGHGTFDGKEAKFNLAGPDLSAAQTAKLLNPIRRPVIFIDTSSSSAPFINEVSATNRIVITATRSGYEENYARFGTYLADSISSPESDIDKDGQVSLLEAFLTASRQVEAFYKTEKRLATEHALLDDNADKKGTAASFFKGVRAVKKADSGAELDGFRAHQLYFIPNAEEARLSPALKKRRNELELSLEKLREKKASMSESDYLKLIEPVILELSRLYHQAENSNQQ